MQPALQLPFIDFTDFFRGIGTALVDFYPKFLEGVKDMTGVLIGISIPVSLFFLIVIVYCVEQLKKIRNKEGEMFNLKVVPAYEEVKASKGDAEMARRWQSVIANISTDNPNDWRQAIIDAYIILDDILTKMGYQGATIGEKLQRVAKGDFATLNDAWEAHKVRNMIAHEGSSFSLNHHEAKKAIDGYKKVFEEFYYI